MVRFYSEMPLTEVDTLRLLALGGVSGVLQPETMTHGSWL